MADRASLDERGYLALVDLLSSPEAAEIAAECAAFLLQLGDAALPADKPHSGTHRLADLRKRLPSVGDVGRRGRLLAAASHVLGLEAPLGPVNYRSPQPGFGSQRLHADAAGAARPGRWTGATAIVALVDFTPRNGATRVVPGSHLQPHLTKRAGKMDHHPDEVLLTGPAGTAFVFNAHLLRSGTTNESDAPRPALQIGYAAASDRPL